MPALKKYRYPKPVDFREPIVGLAASVTADKAAQLIEKRMASPSVLVMLLTTQYIDGLLLHRLRVQVLKAPDEEPTSQSWM